MTRWAVYCKELREKIVFNQNLNYYHDFILQNRIRDPSDGLREINNGIVNIQDPSILSLLGTPFDPHSYIAELRPIKLNNLRYNIPNLAIFLWRLKDYRIELIKPIIGVKYPIEKDGFFIVGINIDPLGRIIQLFNSSRLDPNKYRNSITKDEISSTILPQDKDVSSFHLVQLDETPDFMRRTRLNESSKAGNPSKYVDTIYYKTTPSLKESSQTSNVGLHLYIEELPIKKWVYRGEDLSEWEKCITFKKHEIIIDPKLGRILISLEDETHAKSLIRSLYVSYTYGAVGNIGAHPTTRNLSSQWMNSNVERILIEGGGDKLKNELKIFLEKKKKTLIEIQDNLTYELDISSISHSESLELTNSLCIRAANFKRPIIRLVKSLKFCSKDAQKAQEIAVRLEGLFITRSESFNEELITRAAVNTLEIRNCTLDLGKKGQTCLHSIKLQRDYGFGNNNEFNQIPEIIIDKSIIGPLRIDTNYSLSLTNSIIDAINVEKNLAMGVKEYTIAISGTDNDKNKWGPPTKISGITVFGQVNVEWIEGIGAIFSHILQVQKPLKGCLKYSYITRNMQTNSRFNVSNVEACVFASKAHPPLRFESETFGDPAYGQLSFNIDPRIREQGPENNAMGAFNFLLEADKWRNLSIRFREFMPVGIKPIFFTVT